jgi:hypothetical protein
MRSLIPFANLTEMEEPACHGLRLEQYFPEGSFLLLKGEMITTRNASIQPKLRRSVKAQVIRDVLIWTSKVFATLRLGGRVLNPNSGDGSGRMFPAEAQSRKEQTSIETAVFA